MWNKGEKKAKMRWEALKGQIKNKMEAQLLLQNLANPYILTLILTKKIQFYKLNHNFPIDSVGMH